MTEDDAMPDPINVEELYEFIGATKARLDTSERQISVLFGKVEDLRTDIAQRCDALHQEIVKVVESHSNTGRRHKAITAGAGAGGAGAVLAIVEVLRYYFGS